MKLRDALFVFVIMFMVATASYVIGWMGAKTKYQRITMPTVTYTYTVACEGIYDFTK